MHIKPRITRISLLAGLCVLLAACQISSPPPKTVETHSVSEIRADILQVLQTQQAAWNSGDVSGFMQGYWKSPKLRFASGGDVTRGWQTVHDRYRSRYADKAAMGQLSFTDLETEILASGTDAVIYGRWQLTRDGDSPNGLFMLLLRQFNGHWKIISDTTTSAD